MTSLTDARLAADLAYVAGQLLLERQATSGRSGRDLGKLGDVDSNALILDRLAIDRPEDAVLSEESADSPARLVADRVWIIDPLDGTREFGLTQRPDWAVHVALWERGHGISAAAVSQPALDVVYASDDVVSPTSPIQGLRVVVSASRPPREAIRLRDTAGAQLVPMGSAGAKAMAVVRGEAEAYVHSGGQWEWDSAAPVGVAQAAGLHCSRIDGSALEYNEAHPYLPDLIICRTEVADRILAGVG